MCGIAGFTKSSHGDRLLRKMVAALEHRGPDSEGYYVDDGVSIGMRRLSIIDIASGEQPSFNEDRTVAVVFNGEIYNHTELRAELEELGHTFRSAHSDTEVLVHLYEQYGLDFAKKLNGMFAIALWDCHRDRLVLVRDRVGIKPLYFSEANGEIIFGSEPKALLLHPKVSRDPNFNSINHYFSLKNVPSPDSAFVDIKQLRPGEMLIHEKNRSQRRHWWRIRYSDSSEFDEDEAVEHIRTLLQDAVRIQMRSDVPFGAYLSGGLDSSSIVALMSRLSGSAIRTFTLVYKESIKGKDQDRDFARLVSQQYGTDHHEHVVSYDDIPNNIDRIVDAFDEPYSGVISTFFISELIGRNVKVALSGDGADELFGSYRPHRLATPLSSWRRMRGGSYNLTPEEKAEPAEFEASSTLLDDLIGRGDEAATRMEQYLLDDRAKAELYSPKMRALVSDAMTEDLIRRAYAEANCRDPLNRALYVDFVSLLPDQVLAFVDRLSMAHSLEVRPPFLDHRLVEFVAKIPGSSKIKAGSVKHILKRAVADMLPHDLVYRPKEGFLMPIRDWLGDGLQDYVKETLSPERLNLHGLLDTDAVWQMIDDHVQGNSRNGDRLWNLMMFQRWWERYVA